MLLRQHTLATANTTTKTQTTMSPSSSSAPGAGAGGGTSSSSSAANRSGNRGGPAEDENVNDGPRYFRENAGEEARLGSGLAQLAASGFPQLRSHIAALRDPVAPRAPSLYDYGGAGFFFRPPAPQFGSDDEDEEESEYDDEDDYFDADQDEGMMMPMGLMEGFPWALTSGAAAGGYASSTDLLHALMAQFSGDLGMPMMSPEHDPTVKCPVCSTVHAPLDDEFDGDGRADERNIPVKENKCSHGATMVFFELDQCPVCMEDKIKPAIALPCGHGLCPEDFKEIGGRVGPPKLPEKVTVADIPPSKRDEFHYYVFRENNDEYDEDEEEDMLRHCCETCTRQHRARVFFCNLYDLDPPEPPTDCLRSRNRSSNNNDSINAPLPSSAATAAAGPAVATLGRNQNRNRRNRGRNSRSNNNRGNNNNGNNSQGNSNNNNRSSGNGQSAGGGGRVSSSGGMGGGNDDDDSSDDEGPPPLIPRGMAGAGGGGRYDDDSSDDEEPPPLISREDIERHFDNRSHEQEDNNPASRSSNTNARANNNSTDGNESDDDSEPPPLLHRGDDGNDGYGDSDDDDDSSGSSVPPLGRRVDEDTDSEGEDYNNVGNIRNAPNTTFTTTSANNAPGRRSGFVNPDYYDSEEEDEAADSDDFSLPPLLGRDEIYSSDDDGDDRPSRQNQDEYLPRLIPPQRQRNRAKKIVFDRVQAWALGQKARRDYQKRQKAVHVIQAALRMGSVRRKYKDQIQELVKLHLRHNKIWNAVLKELPSNADDALPDPITWQDIKMEKFDTRRQMVLFGDVDSAALDATTASEQMNEHEETMERLDYAIQRALQNIQDHENQNLDNGSAEELLMLDNEAFERLDEEDDAAEDSTLKQQAKEYSSRPQCDHIQLTKDVLKWLDRQDSKYRGFFLRRIHQLASGERSRILRKMLTGCKTAIWETYLDQKSGQRILWTEYRQDGKYGILVWYVAKHDMVSRLMTLIDEAESRSQRKWTTAATVLFENGGGGENHVGTDGASIMELDNSNQILPDPLGDVPLKLHLLTRAELPKLAIPHWKPRLSLTKEEQACVQKPGTVLLLGRSGTGKTVCIADRMEYDREQVPKGQELKQLFVARSYRICSYVQGLVDGGESQETRFKTKYITFSNLLKHLEGILGIEGRFSPLKHIEFGRFRREKFSPNLDPLIAWSQIRTHIKGSSDAVKMQQPMTKETYMALGQDHCRLSKEHRELAYQAYEAYERFRTSGEFWDDNDRTAAIFEGLRKKINDFDFKKQYCYDKVYVDEIQDYTQAEIATFFLLGHEGGLFLAGDTAQSVVEGVEFRFEDIRSVAYMLYDGNRKYIPDKPLTVNRNFRSHAGILNVAAGILERLFAAFPKAANKLEPDIGVFNGPRPGVLYNLTPEKLQELLERVEGVVLLTHDSHAAELQDMVGKQTMVLGIRESKGLEFPSIIILDFFKGLDAEHQKAWRQMLTIRDDARADTQSRDIITEVESQLKLLYTGVTRASKRLYFAETGPSISGAAFQKWLTVGKALAVRQNVSDVEQMTRTPDEWLSSGVDLAMEAETAEDPKIALHRLEFAIHNLAKGEDKALQTRAELHRASVEFRCKLESPRQDSEGTHPLDPATTEWEGAKILAGLVKEKMFVEARKFCDVFVPQVGEYTRRRLLSDLVKIRSLEG